MSLCRLIRCAEEDAITFLAGRSASIDFTVAQTVAAIIADVRARGDAALLDNARRFDSPSLGALMVSSEELESAQLPLRDQEAICAAVKRVTEFHALQLRAITAGWEAESPGQNAWRWRLPLRHGGYAGQRMLPLASAGIYVPGGKATYPSSVIMNAMPAVSAGVPRIMAATPARADGSLSPAVLFAARECGLAAIAKVGGAAAVAALALGTESIPRMDRIAGPGNRYVNEAKRQLWGQVGLDLYAGPSEVCVLVDETSNAPFAAADWLTQVEHSEDNAGFLVSVSDAKLTEVIEEAESQLEGAPRAGIMRAALGKYGAAILTRDLVEACEVIDAIAPEHLTLAVADPEAALARVTNAGCILVGEYTPESAGDYAIGPSHTLPTSASARFASPLSVLDFLKIQSVSSLTAADLSELSPVIEIFGEVEGLPAHANGARIRRR